ncbi:DUF2865 domain-containing protein [Methylobacterium sp. JK268]
MGVQTRSVIPSLLRNAALGVVIGLGGAVGTTTLVRAADDAGVFEVIFGNFARSLGGPSAPAAEARRPAPRRPQRAEAARHPAPPTARVTHAARSLHTPRISAAPRIAHTPRPAQTPRPVCVAATTTGLAQQHAAPLPKGARSVCVRTCDGYLFPLATLGAREDAAVQAQSCATACPGSEMQLYTVGAGQDLDRAVSLTGQPYREMASAFLYRSRVVASCSCHPDGAVAAAVPPDRDVTLRRGDAIAGSGTAQVFTGAGGSRPRFVEFRRAGVLPAAWRHDLDRRLDVTRREREQAAFRESLARTLRAERVRTRVARAGGFPVLASDAGFDTVRVVVPSPYR